MIVLEKDFQDICKRLQKQLHMIHLLNPEVSTVLPESFAWCECETSVVEQNFEHTLR